MEGSKFKDPMKSRFYKFAVCGGVLVLLLIIMGSILNAKATWVETEDVVDSVSHFYIEELANRRVSIISEILEQNLEYVNNAISIITKEDLSSITSLRQYLGRIRRLYGVDNFSFVDENALVYNEHSTTTGKTRYPFFTKEITKPIYETVINYGGQKQLFLAVPVKGIYFNGARITACFVQVNIDQMVHAMTLRGENMETYFNIYYKNGESLTNTSFGGLEPGRNILSVIKESDSVSDAFHKVLNDFQNGQVGNIDVPYGKQEAHLYYAPVKNTGWMLSLLVYDNVISRQINTNIQKIMLRNRIQIGGTVICIVILFIVLILIIRNNFHFMIENERTLNQETKAAYDNLATEKKAMQIIHSVMNSGPWTIEFNEKGEIEKCIWSQTFREMLGYTSVEEFPDKLESWSNLLHKDCKEKVIKAFWNAVNDYSGNTIYDVEYRLLTKNAGWKWYHAAGSLIRRPDGSPLTFIGLFTDIDETKRNELALKEQFRIVDALSRDYGNVLKIDLKMNITTAIKQEGFIPKTFKGQLSSGIPYEDFCSSYIEERVYPEDRKFMYEAMALSTVEKKLEASGEYSYSYRASYDGEIHFLQVKFMRLEKNVIVAGFMNIDEIVKAAKEKENLRTLSETDQMTGLLNRVSGETKISEALATGTGGLLILLDVNDFKYFNDTFGHGVGDQVIINVAHCLKGAFRDEDIVFRLGGDEFSAYASTVVERKTADRIIKRFTDNLKGISIPELGENPITASIGAVLIKPGKEADFNAYYKLIDKGVYESKKNKNESTVTFKKS